MGGLLQTSAAQVVKQLSINMTMSGVDREMLTNFMESKTGNAPASGEIVCILKNMNDEMSGDLKDAADSHQRVPFLLSEQAVLSDALLRKTYTFWKSAHHVVHELIVDWCNFKS